MKCNWLAVTGALLTVLGAACSKDDDCTTTRDCAAAPATAGDAGPDVDAARVYPEVPPPAGCDPLGDTSGAPECVADAYALFVDATGGSNGNKGTRSAPLRTIEAASSIDALAGRPRIYVCGTEPYVESVSLPVNVSLFGGFACSSWKYSGARPAITPVGAGYALRIDNSVKAVVVADVDLGSKDAEGDGASSIAVFVSSSKATFRRVSITAGKGVRSDVAATSTNYSATPTVGNATTTPQGGDSKVCACAVRGGSLGGKGGGKMATGAAGGVEPFVPGQVGAPGSGGVSCMGGGTGAFGLAGGSGGKAPSLRGTLAATGWTPGRGSDGAPGDPGAGGGGGGGGTTNGGGGGGCGGCGGNGAVGGKAGGASIAMALFESEVTLFGATLTTAPGGNGADGGVGEVGAQGGVGGVGSPCRGGDGGRGAGGGGGGGGPGGLSVPVLRQGGSFKQDATSLLTAGIDGLPGGGGESGTGPAPGIAGEGATGRLGGEVVLEL